VIVATLQTLRHADALILDLRNNTGGSPDTAALLLSCFFDDAALPLFEIVPRSGPAHGYTTERSPLRDRHGKRPAYVLTAERTFSAGEGIAFILQERGRAEIIGERTAGAANPGRPYLVTSNLQVTVPNGKVRTAISGRNWEGDGVVPDIKVAASDALWVAHMRALRQLLKTTPTGSWRITLQQELQALEAAKR
jgi:C-terminal processing protease CtpA/Prc